MITAREVYTVTAQLPPRWERIGRQMRAAFWTLNDNLLFLERLTIDTPRVQAMRLKLLARLDLLEAKLERVKQLVLETVLDEPEPPPRGSSNRADPFDDRARIRRDRGYLGQAGPPPRTLKNVESARAINTGRSDEPFQAMRNVCRRSSHSPSSEYFPAQISASAFLRPRRGRRRARGPPAPWKTNGEPARRGAVPRNGETRQGAGSPQRVSSRFLLPSPVDAGEGELS
jgi:hypothetical protein